jgi:hypothetical protein
VVPEPAKRPRSSCIRFAAGQPSECWQAGFTRCLLAGGTGTEILTWLDDHSRDAPPVTAWNRVTGPIVLAAFRAAVKRYGAPAATLTGNGMVFTTRLLGGNGGRNGSGHERQIGPCGGLPMRLLLLTLTYQNDITLIGGRSGRTPMATGDIPCTH